MTVESSHLDWVIVWSPFLKDDPPKGNVQILSADMQETAHELPREDLAIANT